MFQTIRSLLYASALWTTVMAITTSPAEAYPIFAQQNYAYPREATGKIVCANCHLAKKPVDIEVPQAVLPDTVFEAVVKIPYDLKTKQVLGNGKKGGLNVGAVLMLPEGFKIAPTERLSDELKAKVGNLYFEPFKENLNNIVVVGPLPGKQYQEIVFPVLSPDPTKDKNVKYLKYPIYLGGNRGRGQVYPDGSKSNNTVYQASTSGRVISIQTTDEKKPVINVTIESTDGKKVTDIIPVGPELLIKEGDTVKADQAITNDPNVGGFGQADTEVVLQSADRIKGLLVFFVSILFAQMFLVFKKKQYEKVQLAEMNF
jgi:apocytochrome f